MKETTTGAAKPIAPALNKRTIKDSKGPQQALPVADRGTSEGGSDSGTFTQHRSRPSPGDPAMTKVYGQMERTPENRDNSPPKKKKHRSTLSTLESADFFEATTAGAGREISMLLSQFADVLRKSAAADTAQMKKLQGILTEARNLESYLKEKKNHLRQTLALISDNLQG